MTEEGSKSISDASSASTEAGDGNGSKPVLMSQPAEQRRPSTKPGKALTMALVGDGPQQPAGTQNKKAKQGRPQRPEHSIPFRIAALAMVILLIAGASLYLNMHWLFTLMLTWLAITGTFLSYLFREKRPIWINIVPTIGACAVILYLVNDCTSQISLGRINLIYPFTQALCGFQALHCFDLRTRSDFSISALIGLGLLVCLSGLATNDGLFILCILGYVTCLSALLYFDAVSRSKDVGPSRPIGDGRPAAVQKPVRRQARAATSVILAPVLSLPLLTILVFLCMPRTSSLITYILEHWVRPHFAVSQSDRSRGQAGGIAGGGRPSARGSSGTQGSSAAGGKDAGGTGGGADGNKAVNPLDSRTKGEGPKGIGSNGGQKSTSSYKEGKAEKQDNAKNYMPPAEPSEQMILHFSAPRAGYIRRISFDTYDGKSWSRSVPIKEVEFFKDEENVVPVGNANALAIPRDCPVVEVKQLITVDTPLAGEALPTMWVPQVVAGEFNSVTVQADGTLSMDREILPSTYEVKSYLPIYRASVMRHLPVKAHSDFKKSLMTPPIEELEKAETEMMERYLQLPEDLPKRVKTKAVQTAGESGNAFVKAERIVEFLRKKHFKYKQKNVYRVKGGDVVSNFLFQSKEGNCVDFASAFVIMCRAAGVPARLVGGFSPGTFNERTGFYEVKAKDGHAWAEIYIPNWCWIPFDPTPTGKLPEVEVDEGFLGKLADMGLANPFGGIFQGNRGTPGAGIGDGIRGSQLEKKIQEEKRKAEGKAPPPPDPDEETDPLKRIMRFLRWEIVVVAAMLLSLGVVVYVVFQRQKATYMLGVPVNAKKSTLLFFQVVQDLRKYQIVRLPHDTPLDLVARSHDALEEYRQSGKFVHPDLEPLLSNFMEVYVLDRFGRGSDRVPELEKMSEKIKKLVSANK